MAEADLPSGSSGRSDSNVRAGAWTDRWHLKRKRVEARRLILCLAIASELKAKRLPSGSRVNGDPAHPLIIRRPLEAKEPPVDDRCLVAVTAIDVFIGRNVWFDPEARRDSLLSASQQHAR